MSLLPSRSCSAGVSTYPGDEITSGLVNTAAKGERVRVVADKGSVQDGNCVVYALMVRKDLFDSGAVTKVSDLKGRKAHGQFR